MSQWLMLDFTCPTHGKFEYLCDKREEMPDWLGCPATIPTIKTETEHRNVCCERSPVVDSYAVIGRIKLGEVSQGKNSDSDRPAHILDTRDLGDGMSMVEWEAKQDKVDQDQRWKDIKEMRQ